jgi:hypothetical protein
MIKELLKRFDKQKKPLKAFVLVKIHENGERMYFSYKKNGEVNFCTLRGFAKWFGSATEARMARHDLGMIDLSYDNLNVESFTIE